MGYVTNHSIEKKVLKADVEQIENFLAHQLPNLVSTVAMLLTIFIIMVFQNIKLTFACLLLIVFGFVCQFAVLIKVMKSSGVKENFDTLKKSQQFLYPVCPGNALDQNIRTDCKILSEVL